MATKRKSAPANDLEDIREDLASLGSNVAELARDLKKSGARSTQELKDGMYARATKWKEAGQDQYQNVESNIKSNPAKSVGMAFAAGILASFLFSRTRR